MRFLTTLALVATPVIATADVTVRFQEGAPKDRFVMTSTGCAVADVAVTLDLSTAPAGLIFDVTAAGAGVEVFQPVEVVSGRVAMAAVADGDQTLGLELQGFGPDTPVTISADIDDTLTNGPSGQIIVRGSEIAGASVLVTFDGQTYRGQFTDDAVARVATPGCLS